MEKNATPDISVIIITYKTPLMILRRCIQSIRKQTLTNIEIILLDTNNKGSSYKEAIQSDPDLLEHLIYLEVPDKNEFINGKNAALAKCSGTYVTILSAQDIMPPKRLEEVIRIFKDNSNKTYSDKRNHSEDNKSNYDVIYTDMQVQQKNILESSDYEISTQKYQYLPQLIIRRNCLQKIGDFDSALIAHCDEEMWFRMNSLLRIHHISSEKTTISVNPDFYNNYAPLQDAIGYRQIIVKYAKYFKKNKRQKKILYKKIASQYKAAGSLFRYIQFQIKGFFTGNFTKAKNETFQEQISQDSLTPETGSEELTAVSALQLPLKDILASLDKKQKNCHFILAGNDSEQIVSVSKQIVHLMKEMKYLSKGRIAKITASQINQINWSKFCNQLKGNCLLIEEAQNLFPQTIADIFSTMTEYPEDFSVILAVDKEAQEQLYSLIPEIEQKFDYILDISQYSLKD